MATTPQRTTVLPKHVNVQADATASRVGGQAPLIDKRAADCRPYVIDLQPVLRAGEFVQGIDQVVAPTLQIGGSRPYFGIYVEVTLGGALIAELVKTLDHTVTLIVRTNQGTLQVPLVVRVHPT